MNELKVMALMEILTNPSQVDSTLIQSSQRILGEVFALELLSSKEQLALVKSQYLDSISLEVAEVYTLLHEEIIELMISPLKALASIVINVYQGILIALESSVELISQALRLTTEPCH